MNFFILTVLCNLLSLGSLQETYKEDDYHLIPPEIGRSPGSEWPVQTYNTVEGNVYDQIERTSVQKPCTRRSNSEDDFLGSPLPLNVEKPLNKLTVPATPKPQPKALRNKAYDLKSADYHDPHSKRKLPDDNVQKPKNSITINNPVIDSLEENHRQILTKGIEDDTPESLLVPLLHPAPVSATVSNPTRRNLDQSLNSKSHPPKADSLVHFAPNTEYGDQGNQYIPAPSSVTKSEYHPHLNGDYSHLKTYNSLLGYVAKSEPEIASTAGNKCAHDKKVEDVEHTRRSMSNYNDGQNFPNNEPHIRYAEPNADNENAMASILNVERSTSKTDYEIPNEKTKFVIEKTESYVGRPQYNEVRRKEIMEPTKGDGVVNMGQSALMLMQTDRICYACSTANNPSCWFPDRRTTVKYCRKGNDACITKTFGKGSTFTLIRDCGKSCDDSDTNMLMPRYKSCSMCHTDLCNGAYSINGNSILFALILIALVKYLN